MSKLIKLLHELVKLNNTLNQEQFNNLQELYDMSQVYSDPNFSYTNDYSSYENYDNFDDEIDVSSILDNLGINSKEFERTLYKNHYTMTDFIDGKIPKRDMENIITSILQKEVEKPKSELFEEYLNDYNYNEFYLSYLRRIYKTELNTDELVEVREDFYNDMQYCINEFKQIAIDLPFSRNLKLLEEAQTISKKICKIREQKIIGAALNEVHKNYLGISDDKETFEFDVQFPDNLTPGEKKLYRLLTVLLNEYHNDFIMDASYSEEYDKNIYFFDSIDGNETTINNIESNEHNINSDDSFESYWKVKDLISKEDFLDMVQYYNNQIPSIPIWKIESMVIDEILNKNGRNI